MAGSYRLYYPCESVIIGPEAATSGQYKEVHGLQSLGMSTSFALEPVFELSNLDVYSLVENLPNVELTMEKALDGYPLLYHLTSPTSNGRTLLARTINKCDVQVNAFSDLNVSASGLPLYTAYCSGMYLNSLNYTLPVNGFCKEQITLVGNDKTWRSSGFTFVGTFNGSDSPASGIQRRQQVIMGAAPTGSIWPTNLQGIAVTAGSGYNTLVGGLYQTHIQDVTISCSLQREDLLELGSLKPYYRYARFPVTVDCTINVIAAGTLPGDGINANSNGGNLTDQPIQIKLSDGTVFDLGTKNKLQSVSYAGGDVGGTPVTMAYQFQNYNHLDVISSSDPSNEV